MLTIQILAVGKLKEKYLTSACEEYIKRLSGKCKISVVEVEEYKVSANPSPSEIAICLQKEGQKMLERAGKSGVIVPLCIEGIQLSSEQFSKKLEDYALHGESTITFLIGGSYGLSQQAKEAGDFLLSFSKMTFTHQFARVMLLEQVYRGLSIQAGTKYHK